MDFNNLVDSPNPGLCVFCEQVREEAEVWEQMHENAWMVSYTSRQVRKETPWPEVPQYFEGWDPKKKRGNFMYIIG